MSREKQIEEMAKALTKYEKGLCERLPKDKCLLTSAIHTQVSCDYCKIAEFLYEAGYRKIPDNIGDFSDGYHTFNELYHHRAVLFSVICNMFPEKAWKSKLHDTGDMFDGMFIVGIETEQGQATYHYDIEPYWDMFKVKELEKAPKWDGHTPSDAIQRIGSISSKQSEECEKKIVNQREELRRLNKSITDLTRSRDTWKKQAERVGKQLHEVLSKQSDLTPCDVCQFNPPSSRDNAPCTICPAQAKMKGGAE